MKYTYTQNDHRIFAGFYESILFNCDSEYLASDYANYLNETDNQEYELKDFKGFCLDVSKQIVDKLLSSCHDGSILKSVELNGLSSPKYYNFETDKLKLSINLDRDLLEEYIFNTHANEFESYLNENYSDRSGFISFIANNIHDFKNQYLVESKLGRCLDIMIDFYLVNQIDDYYGQENYDDECYEIANDTITDYMELV